MATRVKSVSASSSKVRIHYHSSIGTHRLKPRPLKNILYPYYRNYKPVYRARNPRTPLYYWPEIDKYPWQSHQKRYVKPEEISVRLFSEFLGRKRSVLTLYELLHPLPLNGVNCLCWKPPKYTPARETQAQDDSGSVQKQVFRIGEFDYVVDESKNNQYYLIKKVDYRIRPFRAKVTADLYMGDKLIKRDVNPMGSVRGVWKYSFPYKIGGPTGPVEDRNLSDLEMRVSNIHLYRPGRIESFKEAMGQLATSSDQSTV